MVNRNAILVAAACAALIAGATAAAAQEAVASLPSASDTGASLEGIVITAPHYVPDLEFFGAEVLPLMKQAGLRNS